MIVQKSLIDQQNIKTRTVYLKNIKATFSTWDNGFYDVVLEINSNKFFLSVQNVCQNIEEFQIICVKGFVELSNKLILLLKNLLSHLFIRLDYEYCC